MDYIHYFKQAIKDHIGHIEHGVAKHTESYMDIFPDDLFKQKTVDFVVHWGKRLRPVLWLLTALNHSQSALSDDIVYPFLSLEAFHKFILTHDDIVDKDIMRYGSETVHTALEQLMPSNPHDTPTFFGNSLGMIGGDLMHSIANDYILDAHCDDSTKLTLLKLLSTTLKETAYGWYIQFIMDYLPLSQVTMDRVVESLVRVTGRYTFSFPIRFGLSYINQLDQFDTHYSLLCDYMGILFQTGDDLIGLFGDPEETGKSDYSDITQGKKTVPMLLTYLHSSDEQQYQLEQLVGKPDISMEEVRYVRNCVIENLPHIRAFVQDYGQRCIHELNQLSLPESQYTVLRGCIEYLMSRDQESNLTINL